MASAKGMGKISPGGKKGKGKTSKATIGAPAPPSPTPTPTPPPAPYTPTTSPTTTAPRTRNDNWSAEPPQGWDGGGKRPPAGDFWLDGVHGYQAPVNAEPRKTMEFWTKERLEGAQPFDVQHGNYDSFDYNAKPGLPSSQKYQDAMKDGPGYVGDVGSPAPKTNKSKPKPKKPSGDQHAHTPGSYAPSPAETIRNVPGTMTSGITNGMTNRDKYVK